MSLLVILGICLSFALVSGNKIVGGIDAVESSAPFQVSLQTRGRHYCGGVIIHKNFVLTAGHCINGYKEKDIKIVAGTNDLKNATVFYHPEKLIVHNRYFKPSYHNDIGLIFIKKNIKFDENVQLINFTKDFVPENATLTLTGFGKLGAQKPGSNVLKMIDLKVIDNEECSEAYVDFPTNSSIVGDGHLCTFNKKAEGACGGDSGGPLTFKNQVVALVNAGIPCAEGVPDIHARISYFHDWIRASIKNYSQRFY